jgi:hypothetical protein
MGQQKSILSRDVFPILIADSEFDFAGDEPLTGNASVMQQIAAFAVAGESEDERINFEATSANPSTIREHELLQV